MKKMKEWNDIDTEPTKAELLKKVAIMFFATTWKIIWFFLRTTLLIIAAILPGISTMVFDDDKRKEEPVANNSPNWIPITTKSGNVKLVMEGSSEEYDDSDL